MGFTEYLPFLKEVYHPIRRSGFTLIELLVVIAMLVLYLSCQQRRCHNLERGGCIYQQFPG